MLQAARDRRGRAIVLRGDAGIGKTAILDAVHRSATDAGMLVLTTNGAEAESVLPFAGLHQLLMPLLDAQALAPRLHRTLHGTFGKQDTRPDTFTVGLAVLELLSDRAADTPLLVLIEDAQWLDAETRDVLVFVARRLAAEPIAAIMAVQAEHADVLTGTGINHLHLYELSAEAAARLLIEHAPDISPARRQRILTEAAGNPLALIELPRCLAAHPPGTLPELLPLSDQLVAGFTRSFSRLPASAQAFVAAFSADPACALPVLLAAARTLTGSDVAVDCIEPAIKVGLLEIREHRLRFRHPLMRSAVYGTVGHVDRLAIHTVLADRLTEDPDRQAWHRGAATLGPDEQTSTDIEAAARRAMERGVHDVAVAHLNHAADLTEIPGRRSSLLLQAAEIAALSQDRRTARHLVAKANMTPHDVADQSRLALVNDVVEPGDLRDVAQIDLLCERAAQAFAAGDTDLAATLCWRAALHCWWASLPAQIGDRVIAVLATLGMPAGDPRFLAVRAHAQPEVLGGAVLRELATLIPDRTDVDGMRYLGSTALVLGDFVNASSFLNTATAGYRAQGRTGLLASTLSAAGGIRLCLGRWPEARAAADEVEALADQGGDHVSQVAARSVRAMHEALCGHSDIAFQMADAVLADPLAVGVRHAAAAAQHARGMAANAAGRHDEAVDMLLRLFDPADTTHQRDMAGWALPDLADAAVRSGRQGELGRILGRVRERAAQFPSPMLHRCLAYATAVLTPEQEAGPSFEYALAMDLTDWPVHRARLDLAYGAWLRRRKRILECRIPLRAARDGFDALGATVWSRRAREELRAAGEENAGRPPAPGQLTAQELQTALLAAAGLSNRQIGQRLFLSHRTVSSHLYKVFPKLGIRGRSQLAEALAALRPGSSDATLPSTTVKPHHVSPGGSRYGRADGHPSAAVP
ncbi:AAA family ATPase [Micromonospora sp. D93]|uniref:AAA family ATPase n=1 Tax=Micromonospora sp. D93 TaxID=2824886 RepID=UPI001FFD7B75|nr:helix-turn-helix transcriptional regulator [Micromonospora sp. D93]